MIIDSEKTAFILPQDKRVSFGNIRDFVLESSFVNLKTLQRFQGKINSMSLAVPAPKLYSRAINDTISLA